jgi:hypothetical protein
LKNHLDFMGAIQARERGEGVAFPKEVARVGRQETRHYFGEGRLPATGPPDNRERLALGDFKGNARKGGDLANSLA